VAQQEHNETQLWGFRMTLTADQVYYLIKQEEAQFAVPAPYVTIDVGTLDAATGTFTGLRTTTEHDPEPVEHLPGQHPANPPPRFIGQQWVSITIDSSWHRTITYTPAPEVPLAPVLLRFSVINASTGWSVTCNGITLSAPAGQGSLLANVWDDTIVGWTLTAGGVTVSDKLRIQRPAGAPGAALGAFTIPVLPVTIIYAPPADSRGLSTATYSTANTVGTSVDVGTSNDQSSTVPVQATGFEGDLQGFTGGLKAAAAILSDKADAVASVFTTVAGQLGQVSSSHQETVSDGVAATFTVSQSTTDTAGTSTVDGGPGDGDTLHYYKSVRMVWSYFDGNLRLCPLDYTEALDTARGLRENPADSNLTDTDRTALLALDPFSPDPTAAVLPTDRFTLLDRLEYGHGATLVRQLTFTRETKEQTTHKDVTTDTTTWDAGPILKALGVGGTTTTSYTLTNATGTDVSDTVTATANLASGPDDYFVIYIWYDNLFGTFAFQPLQPTAEPHLAGMDAKPGQEVILEAGGLQFRTVAGPDGHYQFCSPGIPTGQMILSFS
jgi:hypothetical protein